MKIQTFFDNLVRVILSGAIVMIFMAFLELAAQFTNLSLIGQAYPPGRLIELAAALLVLAIAIVTMQIRDDLRAKKR